MKINKVMLYNFNSYEGMNFSYLFSSEIKTPIKINLINTGDCKEIVQGIVKYYVHELNTSKTKRVIPIQVMPYTIGTERGLNRKIIIEERWKNFFVDNMVSIRGWIQMKKVRYLQDKNPDVPGIIYKLEPENEKHRKLQNVRKLWSAIWHISGIKDIYSGTQLGKTKTFPIFINYDKQDNISDTTKYEDHFVAENRLIAISKSGRSMDSEDVQNFLNATERGIDVQLFVRKNKDDKISKEFYYLGRVIATGNAKQFVMPNTDKTAVEIEWELETPVREDIYQYIVNE